MSVEVEEFLSHYGVKGMKWGVRREVGPDGLVRSGGFRDQLDAIEAWDKKGKTDVYVRNRSTLNGALADVEFVAGMRRSSAHRKLKRDFKRGVDAAVFEKVKGLDPTNPKHQDKVGKILEEESRKVLTRLNMESWRQAKITPSGRFEVGSVYDPETRKAIVAIRRRYSNINDPTDRIEIRAPKEDEQKMNRTASRYNKVMWPLMIYGQARWDMHAIDNILNHSDGENVQTVVFQYDLSEAGEISEPEVYLDGLEPTKAAEHGAIVDDFLAHYGIKGMRWGFRREVGSDGLVNGPPASKDFKRAQRKAARTKSRNKIAFAVAPIRTHFRREVLLRAHDNMPKGIIKDLSKKHYGAETGYAKRPYSKQRAFMDDYRKEFQKAADQAVKDLGTSPGGKYEFQAKVMPKSMWWGPEPLPMRLAGMVNPKGGATRYDILVLHKRVKHDDMGESVEEPVIYIMKPVFDKEGRIVDVVEADLESYNDEEVEHSDISDQAVDDFLAHYGIKGMKWGIRREIGPDGLVNSGKALGRAAVTTGKAAAKAGKATGRVTVKLTRKLRETAKDRKVKKRAKEIKAGKGASVNVKDMEDAELKAVIDRLNLERQYKQLTAKPAAQPKKPKFDGAMGKFIKDVAGKQARRHTNNYLNALVDPKIAAIAKKAMEENEKQSKKKKDEDDD